MAMSESSNLGFLIKEDDSGRAFAILSAVLVIGLTFHAYTFFITKEDDIANKYTLPTYSVIFEENDVQNSDSMLIANGETDVFQLSRDIIDASATSMMAQIAFTISYEETSGQIADPCDEVHAHIPPNGLIADWQNTENVLSDSNDNCETMTLVVYVYPGYTGESVEEVGQTEEYWKDMWSNQTYGSGILELEISVETNQAPGSNLIPTVNDDNEEINIQWTVSFFDADVQVMPL
tara:strand:- start:1924 stop:2628 length:705 start_codon:yes stop_codon:yes gene_type:complete